MNVLEGSENGRSLFNFFKQMFKHKCCGRSQIMGMSSQSKHVTSEIDMEYMEVEGKLGPLVPGPKHFYTWILMNVLTIRFFQARSVKV